MVKSSCSDVDIPEIPIHELVFESMKTIPDRVALVDSVTEEQYTYGQVYDKIRRVASGLRRNGLRPKDILAILSPNSVEYVIVVYAALACGAAVTTINPVYNVYEVSRQFEDCRPGFVYVSADALSTALEAAKRTNLKQTVIVSRQYPGYVSIGELLADDCTLYPENTVTDVRQHIAVIPYSSGTTGLPKAVLLTHYNIVATQAMLKHPDVGFIPSDLARSEQEVCLCFVPFFHVYGLAGMIISKLNCGSTLVIMQRFVPERFLQLIEKYKVTTLPLVPPVVLFMANSPLVNKYDLSSVNQVLCGAAPLANDVSERFLRKMKIQEFKQGYGMTEATFICTFPFSKRPVKQASCGLLMPNMEMQIVDPETKAVLGANQRGEVWIRGPNVMKGYLNKPQATRETIDENGWLHTGDIGYYDNEEYLYIVDRLKELIKYKGFQVAPAELEAVILNHPGVDDVAVIGIPDVSAGELPKAFVVRIPGSSITETDVIKYLAGRVSAFKYLRGGVEFVNSIPKSQSGKILRRELRQRVQKSRM